MCSHLCLAAAPPTWVHVYDTAHPSLNVGSAQTVQGAYCSVCNKAHLASQSVTSNISELIFLLQVVCKSVCLSHTQVCAQAQHLFWKSEYLSSCMQPDLMLCIPLPACFINVISNVLSTVAESF